MKNLEISKSIKLLENIQKKSKIFEKNKPQIQSNIQFLKELLDFDDDVIQRIKITIIITTDPSGIEIKITW